MPGPPQRGVVSTGCRLVDEDLRLAREPPVQRLPSEEAHYDG